MIYGSIENMIDALEAAQTLGDDPATAKRAKDYESDIRAHKAVLAGIATELAEIVSAVFGCDHGQASWDIGGLLAPFGPLNEGDAPHPLVKEMDEDGDWEPLT